MGSNKNEVEYLCALCKVWFVSDEPEALCSSACKHLSWGMAPGELLIHKRTVHRYERPHQRERKVQTVRAYRRIVEIVKREEQFLCVLCGVWFANTAEVGSTLYCSARHRDEASKARRAGKKLPYAVTGSRTRPPK